MLMAGAATTATSQTLTLHYQDRPPYSSLAANGEVTGLVATPAGQALRQAAVAFDWALTPSQRQLALIQQGSGLHCGVGWFRTESRAALGKFSLPLYRDEPFAALARPGALPASKVPAAAAMRAASGSLLVKDGYSYGPQFDALIASATAPPMRSSVEVPQLLRMVAAGRAGWMIVTPEEAQGLLADVGPEAAGLQLVRFSDALPGQTRHLYCNRAVPDAWLARIDQALSALAR
jgi:polar amino acid transport system substrate-binding protein